ILAVTGDNATNNDAMIREMPLAIETFPGEANQVRCFDHIANLSAKTVMRQFD
ncbi:hypothetical protein K474DRAFT_1570699, partial [Panus rudis PR-1116 ss-1]